MKFLEIVRQASTLLQDARRITYRALKREFDLDDKALEDLKFELIEGQRVAVDEEGKVLVWAEGETPDHARSQPANAPAAEPPASAPSPQPEREIPAGERRQLTVMFCDLVGSTALSEQLDPEDLQTIVRTYQQISAQVIERYEGHIAQYLGDGLLVYFGYPVAHEDEAVRAVRAGLGIVEAVQALNLHVSHSVQVRVGIHTGLVVIGEMGSGEKREQLALGETPNIAARVQATAQPDTVVVSAATYRLVQGFFVCHDLGQHSLKGLSAPLSLCSVEREGEAQNRFEVSVQTGFTPLVGREEELELLHRRWERVKAGEGQVVLLSGEAGIGKSRLVQVLREQIADELHLSITCHCSPFYQNSALYPVIDSLQRVLQLRKDNSPNAQHAKLAQVLERVDISDAETTALFASLLSIPLPADSAPLQLSPSQQKEKTLLAVVTWLQKAAEQQPVCFEKKHSAILTLLVAAVDAAQRPARRCRYTWHGAAPTSGCCCAHTTRPPSA